MGVVQQLEILSSAISRNSTAALAFQNAEDARGVLDAFRADPHIVDAALYDASGALFASYRGDSKPRLTAQQTAEAGVPGRRRAVTVTSCSVCAQE